MVEGENEVMVNENGEVFIKEEVPEVPVDSDNEDDLKALLSDTLGMVYKEIEDMRKRENDRMSHLWEQVKEVVGVRATKRQEAKLAEKMGALYSTIVTAVNDSKLPIMYINMVLDIVKSSAVEQARKIYLGG